MGTEAMFNCRSMYDRIAVGRRSASRRVDSRTPVRFNVSAIEKNAIAAVIKSPGCIACRVRAMNPCCCHTGGTNPGTVPDPANAGIGTLALCPGPGLRQNLFQQPCRHFRLGRQKLQPLAPLPRFFIERRARCTGGLVRRELRFILGLQQPVQSVSQQRLPRAAGRRIRKLCALCHRYITSSLLRSSSLASSARPLLMRDFTVPSGIASTCAISL